MKTKSLLQNLFRGGLAVAIAAMLPACFEMKQDVGLKKDGSGTVEMTAIFGAQAVAMMKMGAEAAAQGGEGVEVNMDNPLQDLKNPEKMKEQAAEMGEGVEYVESRDIKFDDGREGVVSVFKFADINKLKVNMNSSPAGGDEEEEKPAESADLVFTFEPGATSKLTITMPKQPEAPAKDEAAGEDEPVVVGEGEEFDAAAMAMMAPMLQGMRVSMSIAVDGEITETNATHRDGNKIVLMDIDMGKLFGNPEMMKKLSSPDDLGDFKKFAAIAKEGGATIEVNEKVVVEFK